MSKANETDAVSKANETDAVSKANEAGVVSEVMAQGAARSDARQMNMIQAINSALDVMMDRDPDVVVMGEDVGYFGGVFRATAGLQQKYGKNRVFDTPITECGIIGVAVGMGAYGLRPVPEIQFADYIYPGLDQLISEAARLRYRSAAEFIAPMTVRSPFGGGIFGGQALRHRLHRNAGIDGRHGLAGAVRLGRSDARRGVHDLALQIGKIDDIVIHPKYI